MSIELEPPIPTAEELQSYADRERESVAIFRLFGPAYYEDVYRLNEWLWEMIFAQAKEEFLRKEPWARQFIK
ncbi:MAG: hypothetical protein WAV38_28530 [Xanthobacteraceae bacterium]|jgi:hypothetical protein